MSLNSARQSEMEGCTAPGVGPQAPAMRLDDGTADGQSHTGALGLGDKECIKDLVRFLCRQSHASIADRDQQFS